MSAGVDDRIIWAPIGHPITTSGSGHLCHWCSQALLQHTTFREALDPMALGTCRYCGERLPVSPDKEKVASEP